MHTETESILSNISSFSSPININKQNFEFMLNQVYSRSFTKFLPLLCLPPEVNPPPLTLEASVEGFLDTPTPFPQTVPCPLSLGLFHGSRGPCLLLALMVSFADQIADTPRAAALSLLCRPDALCLERVCLSQALINSVRELTKEIGKPSETLNLCP